MRSVGSTMDSHAQSRQEDEQVARRLRADPCRQGLSPKLWDSAQHVVILMTFVTYTSSISLDFGGFGGFQYFLMREVIPKDSASIAEHGGASAAQNHLSHFKKMLRGLVLGNWNLICDILCKLFFIKIKLD